FFHCLWDPYGRKEESSVGRSVGRCSMRILALCGLAATLHTPTTSGQQVHGCQPGDPKGYFTGTATSQQSGPLEVSLNLRCADGRYDGQLVTPLGTFAITGGRADSSHLHLLFTAGPDVGTLDATLSADTVRARFAVSGDSGVIALRRIGEARPDGWDIPTWVLAVGGGGRNWDFSRVGSVR